MEDYKKLYEQSQESHKKTIERAISWAKGEHPECFSEAQKAIEFIFPELKESESEDEKVRKSLIDYFSNFHLQTFAGLDPKKILAWLEKQGKETNWKPSKEEMDVLYGLAYITNQYDEHKEEVITRLYQDLKREFFNGSSYENMFPTYTSTEDDVRRRSTIQVLEYARSLDTYNQYGKADIDKNISWLEKQGNKDKFIKEEIECIKGYRENAIKKLEELEKQGEQNPTDKAEPKFHEGEWITNGDYTWKIVEVKPLDYILQSQEGNIVDDTISHVDEQFHSFTIKDAKDGDVLVSDNSIFIFQEEYIAEKPIAYCGLMNGCFLVDGEDACWTNEKCYPATKEQRDTLFSKMKEAGYEWDDEKKELKKIEQKSQRMVSAEAKEALYDKPTDEEMKELLRTEYEKGRANTIAEMEKDWSEEDEHLSYWTIHNLTELKNRFGENYGDSGKCIDWLKQLKQRHTWKPSNEQIDTLEHFVRSIGESGYASPYDNNTKLLYSLLEQLKKLKGE